MKITWNSFMVHEMQLKSVMIYVYLKQCISQQCKEHWWSISFPKPSQVSERMNTDSCPPICKQLPPLCMFSPTSSENKHNFILLKQIDYVFILEQITTKAITNTTSNNEVNNSFSPKKKVQATFLVTEEKCALWVCQGIDCLLESHKSVHSFPNPSTIIINSISQLQTLFMYLGISSVFLQVFSLLQWILLRHSICLVFLISLHWLMWKPSSWIYSGLYC